MDIVYQKLGVVKSAVWFTRLVRLDTVRAGMDLFWVEFIGLETEKEFS